MNGYRNFAFGGLAAALALALPPAIAAIQHPTHRALMLLGALVALYLLGLASDRRGPWLPSHRPPPLPPPPPPRRSRPDVDP